MSDPVPATAADLTDEFVLEKCDYFTRVQLWPLWREVNPRVWLGNFLETEQRHARYLLNAFMYLSAPVVEQIVIDCLEALSSAVVLQPITIADGQNAWRTFSDELRIVIVRGEEPRPTDSGFIFSRIVRDRLDIPESHILDVPQALEQLHSGLDAPIVFLDDFVGSGDQFVDTWTSPQNVGGERISFAAVPHTQARFYYCPVLATATGAATIRRECARVTLAPGHELPSDYSVFDANSLVWPDDLRPSAETVIREASVRAGIPDLDGGAGDWRGYRRLGLTVAFAHGVPDATLPLYWWESDTWNPLKKRHHES
jgi:hypothetical protein